MGKTVLLKNSLVNLAIILALVVVMLGAYTRLTDAGLGCPDWPGCYGHLIILDKSQAILSGQGTKAWTEMIHRYAAGTLACLILLMSYLSLKEKFQHFGQKVAKLPLLLLLLVVFQAVLGMWTVTLKLLPVVVMAHLMGGMLIFSLLCLYRIQLQDSLSQGSWRFFWPSALVIFILLSQIALGGWVSANYAGMACTGFPQCNGQWLPHLHFAEGFNLFTPIGDSYQGGLLDNPARITIQFIHRVGAVITLLSISGLCFYLWKKKYAPFLQKFVKIALFLVFLQFILGFINVVYLLPLPNAVLHNGVAALLLAVMFIVDYLTRHCSYG